MQTLKHVLILIAISCELFSTAAAQQQPNIIWIIADDLSPELGCYGYEGVETPNIDQLAQIGIRYTNAYATAPVCSSSRSALITGVYQNRIGAHAHRTIEMKSLPAPVVPLPVLLKQQGYYVTNCNSTLKKAGKKDYNFVEPEALYDGTDWAQRKPGQPFFAQVQIKEPHRAFHEAPMSRRRQQVQIPASYPDHPLIRADWANYLESIEVLDQYVGDVIAKLKSEGDFEKTVVMFFGDHGRPHYRDKQFLYDGGLRVPLIVVDPLSDERAQVLDELVSLIDLTATTLALTGQTVPNWMDGRDLLATSHKPRDAIFAARDRCGDAVDRIRCVRTQQFKYIENDFPELPYTSQSSYKILGYPGLTLGEVLFKQERLTPEQAAFFESSRPPVELYDVKHDPEELHNLANKPEFRSIQADLKQKLTEWKLAIDDQGYLPEAGLQQRLQEKTEWYHKALQKRGLSPENSAQENLKWWSKELHLDTPQ